MSPKQARGAPKPDSVVWTLWRPILLLAAAVVLALAFADSFPGLYLPRVVIMSSVPSSLLSLDQRVDRIMLRTPMIG